MKKILITWHFPYYGIAFLKHIISNITVNWTSEKQDDINDINQEASDLIFDSESVNIRFKFDKIYQFSLEQEVFDKITTTMKKFRFQYLDQPLGEHEELKKVCKDMRDCNLIDYKDECNFISSKYPELLSEFKKYVWKNIHHHSVKDQQYWFVHHSNFQRVYNKVDFEPVFFENLESVRDSELKIAKELKNWFVKKRDEFEDAELFIITTLCTTETQVVWHILAEAGVLPRNTHFLKVYDDKIHSEVYLKNFSIKKYNPFVISEVKSRIVSEFYQKTKSESRKLVKKIFEQYINTGFSILLMGEKGTGKSHLLDDYRENKNFAHCNCAAFPDDNMFESDFFGYNKGAFTNAVKDKEGLLKKADGGILFMDEVHHLSKRVQAKLMTTFGTNAKNEMNYHRLNNSEIETVKNVKLVFATNKSIDELKECLLPDFYDRVVQQVIEIPPLRQSRDDIEEDFKKIWVQMQFKNPCPRDDKELFSWLREIPLLGNYRDLQNIAISYNNFMDFDDSLKKYSKVNTAFEFAKKSYEAYYTSSNGDNSLFKYGMTSKEIVIEFRYRLYDWAINTYGNIENAAKALAVTSRALSNWKNKITNEKKE